MAAIIFCCRLTGSNVTVTRSLTCMDWLRLWYNHVADLVSSLTALAFVTNMSEKHLSTSPSAIQVKNRRKLIGTVEKLDVISWIEKGERSIDICHNVRLTHSSIAQIVIMLIELMKVLSQELKCFCSKTTTVLLEWTVPKTMDVSLTFLLY
jgi:hypothetical protein